MFLGIVPWEVNILLGPIAPEEIKALIKGRQVTQYNNQSHCGEI